MYHKDICLPGPVARHIQEKDMVVGNGHDRVVAVGLKVRFINSVPFKGARFGRDLVGHVELVQIVPRQRNCQPINQYAR